MVVTYRFGLAGPPVCGTVEEWLASAHPSPSTVRDEWSSPAGLALIPLGASFDAVRIPEQMVYSAVGSDEACTVGARLAECLAGGPVIHDPGFGRYYALVPPGTVTGLPSVAECLGVGTYLGVPRVDRTEPDEETRASYWVVAMSRPGALCPAAPVVELALAGAIASGDEGDAS